MIHRGKNPTKRIHDNNFDLLRLFAAFQVMYFHGLEHLAISTSGWLSNFFNTVFLFFPGVQIFFVISGFLVSQSYDFNHPYNKKFYWHRFLRVYPALWVCFLFTLGMLVVFGMLNREIIMSQNFAVWTGAQMSVGQFYNPEFLRGFGVGVVNGSLWTIPVEVGFYITLPWLYRLTSLPVMKSVSANIFLIFLFFLSYGIYWACQSFMHQYFWMKLVYYSVAAHLWLFLTGVLLYRNFAFLQKALCGKAGLWTALFLSICFIGNVVDSSKALQAIIKVPQSIVMACWVISSAFSWKGLGNFLGGQDISYGMYLYHMPVVNAFICMGFSGNPAALFWVSIVVAGTAALSWFLVERNALALKGRVSALAG